MQKCVSTWETYRNISDSESDDGSDKWFRGALRNLEYFRLKFFSSKILADTESLRAQAGNLVRLKMLPPNATNQCYCMSNNMSNNLKLPWSEIWYHNYSATTLLSYSAELNCPKNLAWPAAWAPWVHKMQKRKNANNKIQKHKNTTNKIQNRKK